MSTKAELENQIENVLHELNFNAPVAESQSGARNFFVGLGMIMLVAILAVAGYKVYYKSTALPPLQATHNYPVAQNSDSDLRNQIFALRSELNALKAANQTTDLRSKQNREKIQVLGIVTNENAIVAKYKYDDYMMINRNWKLNNAPKFLKIGESDQRYIQTLLNQKYGALIQTIPGEDNVLPSDY